MQETTRTIPIEDVQDALMFIRDNILTDDTVSTFFDAVTKTTNMFLAAYIGIKTWYDTGTQEGNIARLKEDAAARGIAQETIDPLVQAIHYPSRYPEFQYLQQHLFTQIHTSRAMVSFEGILEAITFIVNHLKTSGDILQDIKKVVEAVATIQDFKAQDVNEQNTEDARALTMRKIDDSLLPIYTDITSTQE